MAISLTCANRPTRYVYARKRLLTTDGDITEQPITLNAVVDLVIATIGMTTVNATDASGAAAAVIMTVVGYESLRVARGPWN